MSALVSAEHTECVMGFVEEGKRAAELVAGGERLKVGSGDRFVAPTVFDGVTNDHRIAREEISGLVLSVLYFDTEKEAVRLANDTIYGLAASVWTSVSTATEIVIDQRHRKVVTFFELSAQMPLRRDR